MPCSQTKPAKICSVNFRPFNAYKERSEFKTVPCPKKSLHSFYALPCHPTLRYKKRAAQPPQPSVIKNSQSEELWDFVETRNLMPNSLRSLPTLNGRKFTEQIFFAGSTQSGDGRCTRTGIHRRCAHGCATEPAERGPNAAASCRREMLYINMCSALREGTNR